MPQRNVSLIQRMREIFFFFNFYLKKTRLAIQEKIRCLLKDGTSRLVIFLSRVCLLLWALNSDGVSDVTFI